MAYVAVPPIKLMQLWRSHAGGIQLLLIQAINRRSVARTVLGGR
jgi:hypothetical protein